jgi:hypothetical protein
MVVLIEYQEFKQSQHPEALAFMQCLQPLTL